MRHLLVLLLMASFTAAFAQPGDIPILAYRGSDASKPLIFYISGDGGWNSFSSNFMKGFNREGYSIIGLNARSYFWSRKKPQQAANDISRSIDQYVKTWNIKGIVLIGYSFGADVVPFIENNLPPNISSMLQHTVLMSPSKKTDFEVHVLGMMGFGGISNGKNVADEINKLTMPVTLVFGSDENDFPIRNVHLKNMHIIQLAGGHHYDGNVEEVTKEIIEKIKRQ